jgi:hypothetical protein
VEVLAVTTGEKTNNTDSVGLFSGKIIMQQLISRRNLR